jgi:hypothetical protein
VTFHIVGFEVITAVSTKVAVFWVVASCSLVEVYQRFRGPCCLHHQGDDSTTTHKTAIFTVHIVDQNARLLISSLSLRLLFPRERAPSTD